MYRINIILSKVHVVQISQLPLGDYASELLALVVQQPSRHFLLNLEKRPPNQVIADFGRGSSVESESE